MSSRRGQSFAITGPIVPAIARHSASARRKSGCSGIMRPLPLFAERSRNSTTAPMAPFGSLTISHVRCAIWPARRPAFADRSTMILFRRGCRVVSAKASRSLIFSSDRILACLPGILCTKAMSASIQTNQIPSNKTLNSDPLRCLNKLPNCNVVDGRPSRLARGWYLAIDDCGR